MLLFSLISHGVIWSMDTWGILTDDGQERDSLESTGESEEERDEGADDSKDNAADAMVSYDVHFNSKGQDVSSHDEDENQCLHNLGHPFTNRTKDELCRIGKAVQTNVSSLELVDNIASVCSHDAKTGDEEDTRNEADSSDNLGQREDS